MEYLERKDTAAAYSGTPKPPVHLTKSMSDSVVTEFLPFRSEPEVREDYVSVYGTVQIGKVLEDLDALAGSAAYRHCDDGRDDTPPLTIVTASVDRIDLINRIPVEEDIRMEGRVTYVGTSSMEVSLKMETVPREDAEDEVHKVPIPILAAKFMMVARDHETGKAARVNGLALGSDEERRLFKMGAEQKARKKVESEVSLEKLPPSNEEKLLVHALYLEYRKYLDRSSNVKKPDNVVWMKDTLQRSLVMCMPQDRNIHNNIFGGYLMRLAYELSYSAAVLFTHSRVYFVSLDDISFKRPVPIGALLSLTAQVVYAHGAPSRSLMVRVRADVIDPLKGTEEMTNEFFFTFIAPHGHVPRVLPQSYEESMFYIDGKRRKDAWISASKHNTALFGEERLKGWET
ncbi:Acyl-coenzyme A thioesterase 9, mitochondrial [Irineochytrium annulatum]|nr:Acyl-coenzyme A thioesterase 9, mitochondrial [Irineochytrium annulatum]